MRSDPSQYVLSVIDDMEETLAIMRRDYRVEGSTQKIRLINRHRGDAVKELYVDRRHRSPYRGFPA
eukprot:8828339-Karenia_brevis.AAC.1